MRLGADRCKALRHRTGVFTWDNRVQAISSVAKGAMPIRWEHTPDYASALSLSVAHPQMPQRGRYHTVGSASGVHDGLFGRYRV